MRYLLLLLFICGFSTELIAQKANQMTILHRRSLDRDSFDSNPPQWLDNEGYLHVLMKGDCVLENDENGNPCVHPIKNKSDTCFYTYSTSELYTQEKPWCCSIIHYIYDITDTLDRTERICHVDTAYWECRKYTDFSGSSMVEILPFDSLSEDYDVDFKDDFIKEIRPSGIDTSMYLTYHSIPKKPENYKRILRKEMKQMFKNKKDYKAEMKICKEQNYNRGLFRRADLDQDGKEELIALYFRQNAVFGENTCVDQYDYSVYMPEDTVHGDRKMIVDREYFAPSPQLRILEFTDNQWKPVGMRYVRLNKYPRRILVLNVNRGKTVNVIVGIEEIYSDCWQHGEICYLFYDFYSVSE